MATNCKECGWPLDGRKKLYCSDECGDKQRSKRYYASHKDVIAGKRAKWREENPLRSRYLVARADVKARGRKLLLSYEEMCKYWTANCHYCNNSVDQEGGIALDRIDNDGDYEVGNVLTCCGDCNKIRNTVLTVEEMKVAMKAVLELRKSKMIGDK